MQERLPRNPNYEVDIQWFYYGCKTKCETMKTFILPSFYLSLCQLCIIHVFRPCHNIFSLSSLCMDFRKEACILYKTQGCLASHFQMIRDIVSQFMQIVAETFQLSCPNSILTIESLSSLSIRDSVLFFLCRIKFNSKCVSLIDISFSLPSEKQ